MRTPLTLWTTALALALLVAGPAAAAGERFQLRVGAPWVDSGLDYREVDEDVTVQALGRSGAGLGISLEQRVSDRLGWELGLFWSRNDVDLRVSDPAEPVFQVSDRMTPLTLMFGPDIHLTPGRKADLYFGPVLAWMLNNDLAFEVGGERLDVAVDDNFAWGGVLGLDVPVGEEGWYFCGSVRYLDAETEMRPPGEILTVATDPLMVAVGVGYSF